MRTTSSLWTEYLTDKKALEEEEAKEMRTSRFDPIDLLYDKEVTAEYRRLVRQTPDPT